MTFAAEDTAAYMDVANGFATSATLAGAAVTGILSTGSIDSFDGSINTREHTFRVLAADAPAADPGQTLVVDAVTYTVRRVDVLPPDGTVLSLVLSRAT